MSKLREAVTTRNIKEVKQLLDSGANVNEKIFWNFTSLHLAAQSGSLEMVQYLVDNGADVDCLNGQYETALHCAVTFGSIEMVKYLVEHGADVNCRGRRNRTALHCAVIACSLEMVKYLVENGADINCKNVRNGTSLHCAVTCGSLEIVKYLVDHGADINCKTRSNETALHCAVTCCSLEMVKYLVNHGAMVTKDDCDTCNGNEEIFNILKKVLMRSIKHREKLHLLRKIDEQKLAKIGGALKCCTNEISFLLGKGCNGTSVYVGVMHDDSEVAVKRMLTQACEESARNEIEILNRIETKKSPFIVNYRDFYHDETFMYLILDLCEETLKEHVHSQTAEHLKVQGPRMIKEILTGLEFLHSLGILHRDLKPTNVLVDVEGHMRLADFGVSRVLNEDETTVCTDAKGTRDWMPVEAIKAMNKGEKCRFKRKSDVQVAGMIGFFILTKGEHPHGSSSFERMANILKGNPVNLGKLPNLDARQFLAKLISHKIADRPYANKALSHSFMIQVKEYVGYPQLTKHQ